MSLEKEFIELQNTIRKEKYFISLVVLLTVSLTCIVGHRLLNKPKNLIPQHDQQKVINTLRIQDSIIHKQNEIIKEHYNHVTRMQLIINMDTLKDCITYKDKLLHKINIRKLLREDLRPKTKLIK